MTLLEAVSPTARRLLKTRPKPSVPITAGLRQARAFDAAMTLVLDNERIARVGRSCIVHASDDERLIGLAARTSAIGGDVSSVLWSDAGEDRDQCLQNLQFELANLAAYALLWATAGQKLLVRGCKRIQEERQRQRDLLKAGQIKDDVSSAATDHRRKFRVLLEEVGEVAHALDQIEHHGLAAGNLTKELTQVAAVCVAWLESLEGVA